MMGRKFKKGRKPCKKINRKRCIKVKGKKRKRRGKKIKVKKRRIQMQKVNFKGKLQKILFKIMFYNLFFFVKDGFTSLKILRRKAAKNKQQN